VDGGCESLSSFGRFVPDFIFGFSSERLSTQQTHYTAYHQQTTQHMNYRHHSTNFLGQMCFLMPEKPGKSNIANFMSLWCSMNLHASMSFYFISHKNKAKFHHVQYFKKYNNNNNNNNNLIYIAPACRMTSEALYKDVHLGHFQ